jgi:WD40 repeat protein
MDSFCNENILRLIIDSFSIYQQKQTFYSTKNKTICQTILKLLTLYNNYFPKKNLKPEVLKGHMGRIYSICCVNNTIISASEDSILIFWGLKTGSLFLGDSVMCVISLPDGNIACCTKHGQICIYDNSFKKKSKITLSRSFDKKFTSLILLPNGNFACAAYNCFYSFIIITEYNGKNGTQEYPPHQTIKLSNYKEIYSMVNLNENYFATSDKSIDIWDASQDYKLSRTLHGHQERITSLLFLKKDNYLFSGSYDNTIKVWAIDSYQCINTTIAHDEGVTSLLLLPNGFFASGSVDKKIKIWDMKDYLCVDVLKGHKDVVSCLALMGDKRIVSSSYDKTLMIW